MIKTFNSVQPNIRSYLVLSDYLEDYFIFRKNSEKFFSYDIWAAELSFNSGSFLRMVSKGKRNVTPKFIKVFSEKMKFSIQETEHMTYLAKYNQSRSENEKKIYYDKLIHTLKIESQNFEIKDYIRFLSNPQLSSMMLLIGFEDFIATNDNLKKSFGLSTKDLQMNLRILQKLNLIEKKTEAKPFQWVAKYNSFKIPDKVKDKALQSFHKSSLEESSELIQETDMPKRFRSIYFSLAQEDFEDLKNETEDFLKKMKFKYSSTKIQNKSLYKLNLQTHPVTKKIT